MNDIYTLGFDKNLNRTLAVPESPLVYDILEDRMSRLIQADNTVTSSITGLQVAIFEQ